MARLSASCYTLTLMTTTTSSTWIRRMTRIIFTFARPAVLTEADIAFSNSVSLSVKC